MIINIELAEKAEFTPVCVSRVGARQTRGTRRRLHIPSLFRGVKFLGHGYPILTRECLKNTLIAIPNQNIYKNHQLTLT